MESIGTITQLNDHFRSTFTGGKVMLTEGIRALDRDSVAEIICVVRDYDDFTPDNDPYGEHDFGSITYQRQRIFWKIDYYDTSYAMHSPDPANPNVTKRVLTIMLANEY